ncbi:MAG: hypothetical protein Q7U15_02525, partial [Methylotenera sp.]|nr:hypothetical protein [Methylotenera sp.]
MLPDYRSSANLVAVDWLSAQYLHCQGARRTVFPPLLTQITQSRWAVRANRPAIQPVQKRTNAL